MDRPSYPSPPHHSPHLPPHHSSHPPSHTRHPSHSPPPRSHPPSPPTHPHPYPAPPPPPPPPTRPYRFSLWLLTSSNPYLSHPDLLTLLSSLPVLVDGLPRSLHRQPIPGGHATLPFIRGAFTPQGRWIVHTLTDPATGVPVTQPWTVFSYTVDLPDPLPPYGSYVALRRDAPAFEALNRWLQLDEVVLVQVGGSRLVPAGRQAQVWTSTYGMHVAGGEMLDPQIGNMFLCIDLVEALQRSQ